MRSGRVRHAARTRAVGELRSLGKTHLNHSQGGQVSVGGVLHVHSAPPALCPHLEWAVAGVLGLPVSLPWVSQPAAPGMLRAELNWQGRPGAAASITSALAGWNRLRFEVTEEASPGCDALRFSYTPDLGLFSAVTMANGDILVPESRLRAAVTVAAAAASGVVRMAGGHGPVRPARWRRNWPGCSASPGTTSLSRSAAPPMAPRSAGCTPPADLAQAPDEAVTGRRRRRAGLAPLGRVSSLGRRPPSWLGARLARR